MKKSYFDSIYKTFYTFEKYMEQVGEDSYFKLLNDIEK